MKYLIPLVLLLAGCQSEPPHPIDLIETPVAAADSLRQMRLYRGIPDTIEIWNAVDTTRWGNNTLFATIVVADSIVATISYQDSSAFPFAPDSVKVQGKDSVGLWMGDQQWAMSAPQADTRSELWVGAPAIIGAQFEFYSMSTNTVVGYKDFDLAWNERDMTEAGLTSTRTVYGSTYEDTDDDKVCYAILGLDTECENVYLFTDALDYVESISLYHHSGFVGEEILDGIAVPIVVINADSDWQAKSWGWANWSALEYQMADGSFYLGFRRID